MKTNKLEINQTIFFLRRNFRGHIEEGILEAQIATIGNKFFTVKNNSLLERERFSIEKMYNDNKQYSANIFAYLSKEEILNEREKKLSINKIREAIGQYGDTSLTLEQVRSILSIIEEKTSINSIVDSHS